MREAGDRGLRPPTLVREAALEGGAIRVRLLAPLRPSGEKLAVIGPEALADSLVGLGTVAISYGVEWERLGIESPVELPESAAANQPPLAAGSADGLGEPFLHRLAAEADGVLPRILDWLETVPEVDPERIVLVGTGAAGFTVLAAATRDPRVAAVAALFACGDLETLLSEDRAGGTPLLLDSGYRSWVRSLSATTEPTRLVPAPVLLASRSDDPLVPPACIEETVRTLRSAYAAAGMADRVEYLTLATGDDGHAAVLAWVDRLRAGR